MTSVLRISEAASMALHAVALLSNRKDGPVATKYIAGKLSCSEAHLSKVLQRLTKEGLLQATRGPRGGFVLAKAGDQITLLEVLESIDGPLHVDACLFEAPICEHSECMLGNLLNKVNEQVRNHFESTKMSELNCPRCLDL